jgi:hypothetical protein
MHGAHSRADQTRLPVWGAWTLIAAICAGLLVYTLAFLFNNSERVAIGLCFGVPLVGCFAVVRFGAVTLRLRKWFAVAAVLLFLANVGLEVSHGYPQAGSTPAPAVFYPVVCVVVLAGVVGGLIAGITMGARDVS